MSNILTSILRTRIFFIEINGKTCLMYIYIGYVSKNDIEALLNTKGSYRIYKETTQKSCILICYVKSLSIIDLDD